MPFIQNVPEERAERADTLSIVGRAEVVPPLISLCSMRKAWQRHPSRKTVWNRLVMMHLVV